MKTLTIPKKFGYPTLDVTVNGKVYTVKSGEEITIEDHIAEAIENAIALAPKIGISRNKFAQFVEGSITEINGSDLEGITVISPCAFYNYDSLVSMVIPNSVTHIGYSAFGNCNGLVSLSIGNGVKTVGYNAFEYCTALTSIEIPKSVTVLGSNVFKECTGLKKVILRPMSPPSITTDTFLNVSSTCVFEVPVEALNTYKTAANWSALSNQIVAIKE